MRLSGTSPSRLSKSEEQQLSQTGVWWQDLRGVLYTKQRQHSISLIISSPNWLHSVNNIDSFSFWKCVISITAKSDGSELDCTGRVQCECSWWPLAFLTRTSRAPTLIFRYKTKYGKFHNILPNLKTSIFCQWLSAICRWKNVERAWEVTLVVLSVNFG